MKTTLSRRKFLKGATTLSLIPLAPNLLLSSKTGGPASPKLRFAVIGVGGITQVHYPWVHAGGHDVTILCDVDTRRLDPIDPMIPIPEASFPKGYPKARRITDYRDIFAKHGDEFDVVLCGSADHHHFTISELALKHGKPIYCEKPLCWSPEEGFRLGELTRELKVPTQMGNQGISSNGWRYADAYYHQGDLGDIVEVHAWIHGDNAIMTGPQPTLAKVSDPVPDYLDWSKWLGPVGNYPYMETGIHPGAWRWWIPFGGGQIGDWGCHVFGGIFKTLEGLPYPERVEIVKMTEFNGEHFPEGMTVKWHFGPHDGRPALDMYFHTTTANNPSYYPPRPEALEADRDWPISKEGCYWVGTKNTFLMHDGWNIGGALIPNEKRRELGRPTMRYPLMKGNNFTVHGNDLVASVTGQQEWNATASNFEYGARLSTVIQMGNAALRAGHPLQIDPATGWPVNPEDHKFFCRQDADAAWYSL